MQVSVEVGNGLERELSVDLSYESFAKEFEKRLQGLSRTARLPGFRPGKVPLSMLRQRYGEEIQHEVLGEMIDKSYGEAIKQESLDAAGILKLDRIIDPEQKKVGYKATIEVMPEVELVDISDREIKKPVTDLSDKDVDEMLERLREQRKTWQPVERAAKIGDSVEVDFDGTTEDGPIPGGKAEHFGIELGSGRMIPGFEDGIVGLSAGEEKTITVTFPEDYQEASLAGKKAEFKINMHQVSEPVLPEIDDEFMKSLGMEDTSLEAFRKEVMTNMEREINHRIKDTTKQRVMDLLLETHEFDIPVSMVARESHALGDQFRARYQQQSNMQIPDSIFEEQAKRRVKLGLILGAIIDQEKLEADPERVKTLIENAAATYEDPKEFIEYCNNDQQTLSGFRQLAIEDQIVDKLLEKLKVEEEKLSFAELTSNAQ